MTPDEVAAEVHKKLCAIPDNEAAQNPHAALLRCARQVAFHHPIAWCTEIWLGRHSRKVMRERLRKEQESRR